MRLAVDLHENLIEVPLPVRIGSHTVDPVFADLRCEHWAKSVPPEPNRLVADFDTALMQQVFNVTER